MSWPGRAVLLPTTVASSTVSSTVTSTAPDAWRAISPVSSVTVCGPYWNDLVTLLNIRRYPYNTKKPCAPRASQRTRLVVMRSRARALLAQTELFDQVAVRIRITVFQVIKKLATTADHAQQTATRMVVFAVCFEVFGKIVDASGKQCHLDFG